MYYRRPRRHKVGSYFMPFFIIALIFGGLFLGWRSIQSYFVSQNQNTFSEKVFLDIESGSAKAMTVGKKEWQNAPDKIYLYRGEKIKTGSDGRVSLTYFDESEARLDTATEMEFKTLKKKNETFEIESQLNSGQSWINVNRINNPDSRFSVRTPLLAVSTRGAVFAVDFPGTVYVMEGNTQIEVKNGNDTVKTYSVGVGQQLSIDEKGVESVRKGEDVEVIFALSETFKKTNWYQWNQQKDNGEEGEISIEEEGEEGGTESAEEKGEITDETAQSSQEEADSAAETLTISTPQDKSATNQSGLTVKGRSQTSKVASITVNEQKARLSSDGSWSANIKLTEEGQSILKIKAADKAGKTVEEKTIQITYDKTPPEKPKVTSPENEEGKSVLLEEAEQIIEGTVDKDVQAVVVNDYRLTQYVPGSGTFKYFAKTDYGNLKAGENEYKIYAVDKAGNTSKVTLLVLKLDEATVEAAKEERDKNDRAKDAPADTSGGGVKFTSPNNGESFHTTETEFELRGIVPENTDKVTVNDYKLSKYEPGSTTFSYRAYASMGNLKIGEKNTYTAKAFDKDDKLLGQATITIDVESGDSAAPVINIPSEQESYETTLDTVVIGGSVGKWVTRIYVNDKEIKEYIPGSESFKLSVQLEPGENSFTVKAEKEGEAVGTDTIKIKYTR